MKHIVHQAIGRLPSHTVSSRMMLEGLSLSEIQLGEKLSEISQSKPMVRLNMAITLLHLI